MECPKCQFDNREGAKFCNECGAKFELACPACGSANRVGSKFCDECGSKLSLPVKQTPQDLSFDEKLSKIQKYLPKGLTEKILSQKDGIEGERKQVTVMFCDMEGFTTLSELLGIEEAYAVIDQVYEILIHKVHDYEGTVNELTGDGIMALFGAPVALEDAPQRAIRSSLAIHREMARFSNKLKQKKKNIPDVKMRIGIHTGPVVVGTVGNDLRVEFKAVGDTVNLASRMEALAQTGTTYITEDAFKLTEGLFRFEALGQKEIKGKQAPVRAYRVIAPSTRRTRFDVHAERGLTPFVGRDRELDLLLDGFERTRKGRGQAFSIIAEAGVGKSRLLYEFRKTVVSEDHTFLEGKCLSYSRNVAYHPIIDILKSNFDIREHDKDSEIRQKVQRQLKILEADEASTLPYLLELLSVKDSGMDEIPISPEAKKDRIMEAVKRIALKGSEIRPLIVAVEDLHWIDRSSEEYVKNLLDSISGARVFLLFTYRPEFVHTWGGRSYHSQVNLNRLSNRESLLMVSHHLGTDDIDRDLEDLIIEKTEGVPFFIEEFIKSLKELKIIERKKSKYHLAQNIQEVSIPSTIQDVIMARVDTLPEGTKDLLQTGSVIEREFSHQLIKEVTGLPEQELLSRLATSKDSEILYERGIYPQSTYVFKHALTRDVVYGSILTKRKKELHEKIGYTIETLYHDNLDQYFGMLIEHFIESGDFDKGAEYSKIASQKAEKTGSLTDAITYALKRVKCLESLPGSDSLEAKIVHIRTILGLFMIEMNLFKEAHKITAPITESALNSGDKKRRSQILTVMGACRYAIEDDYPGAFEYLEEALSIAGEIGDTAAIATASFWLGNAQNYNCEFDRGETNIKRAEEIARKAKSPWREATLKGILGNFVYYNQGRIDLAYETSRQATGIAEKSDDIYSKIFAYCCHGINCFGKGFFHEALDFLSRGRKLSERLNHNWWNSWSNHFLGEVYFETGQYEKAINHYHAASSFLGNYGIWPSAAIVCKTGLTRSQIVNDEKGADIETLIRLVPETRVKLYEGWIRRYISEIYLHTDEGRMSEAEKWIEAAIRADKSNGVLFELGRDYALYAQILRRKGDESKSLEYLNKALDTFKKCGADGWVEKYEH